MNTPRTMKALAALLFSLIGIVQAQGFIEWVDEAQQCWLAHESIQIRVTGAQAGDMLHWGDGTVVEVDVGDGVYGHAYPPGEYGPVLYTESGDAIDELWAPVFYAYSLTVEDSFVLPGETVTLTLSADPDDAQLWDGGVLRWGDGATEMVWNAGTFSHAYMAPGSYATTMITNSTTPNCEVVGDTVIVEAEPGDPQMDVHPTRGIPGQAIYADVIDEPLGGSIDWADGAIHELDGSGSYRYGYDMAGEYLVTLLDSTGTQLASQLVIITEPRLELLSGDSADLGEPVTVLAEGNADPALLTWGDGNVDTVPAGGATFTHTYDQAGFFELILTDEATGEELAWLELEVTETEFVEVEEAITVLGVEYRAGDGLIEVTVLLDPLVEGADYLLQDAAIFRFLENVGPSETMVLEYDTEGSYTLSLERRDTGEQRATAPLELAWPRHNETMTVLEGEPHLAGDTLTLLLTGLNPEYEYTLHPYGDRDIGRTITGVERWEELAYYANAGLYDATLTLHLPGHFGADELLDSALLEVQERTGNIAVEGGRIPYVEPTRLELTNLVPGARYRIDLGLGELHEFTAFSPVEYFEHSYLRMPSAILLESEQAGGGTWTLLDSAVMPSGMEMTGELALEHGGTVAGAEQTFVVSGLAPGGSYLFRLLTGEEANRSNLVGESEAAVSRTFEADENGAARIEVTVPPEVRALEEHTPMYAFVDLNHLGSDVRVDDLAILLAPLQRTLNGHVVRVTELTTPLTPENYEFPDLHALGVVDEFVLAGRLQEELPVRFLDQFQVDLQEPLEMQLPARFQGMTLTFDHLVLAVSGIVGYKSSFAGRGTLVGAPFTFSSGEPDGSATVYETLFGDSGELLIQARLEGAIPVGDTGWQVASGAGTATFTIDLSESATFRLHDSDSGRLVQDVAYDGLRALGLEPAVDPASDVWTGVVFQPGGGASVGRDPSKFDLTTSRYFMDAPVGGLPITWTAAGFNFQYESSGSSTYRRWDVDYVRPYTLQVGHSQILREEPALVSFEVPLFESPLVMALKPSGNRDRDIEVVGSVPVVRNFGMTALVADQPRFVVHGDGSASIAFDRAVWTLDNDLAADGTNLDTTTISHMRRSVESLGLPPDAEASLSPVFTALDTVENLMSLQLPMDGLTLDQVGNVSLAGEEWKTLAATPELDLFGFPYMSGANAEIGIKKQNDEYAIGLRGGLSLGGIVTATAAPSWYYVKDGKEQRWVFDGVNATLGDPNGLVPTPATFNLMVGGLVSLAEGDNSLELNGAGELTIGISSKEGGASAEKQLINIQVAGGFGINDSTADMTPYWFVFAGVDLAAMNRPIPVKVKGVDVFAFYAFRGGIGHNLRLDQRTGNAANETCAVDDAFVGDDIRPAVLRNALDCFDDSNDLALLAGTLIGWHQKGAEDYYGLLWHVNTNLTLNSSGQVVLGGRGWAFKTLDDGYRADATPNMMARITADANGIFGSFCLGAVGRPIGELDCSGLEEVSLTIGGFKLLEAEANAELKASWASGEYYFAIGRPSNKVSLFIFPDYTQGYIVAGYINTPGVVEGPLPASGMWASMYVGKKWEWRFSEDMFFCDLTAWATADVSFGGAIRVQLQPRFGFDGEIGAEANASAGVKCGLVDTSISVRIKARGRITAPTPFQFSGTMTVTGDLPVIGEINVSVPNVTLSF